MEASVVFTFRNETNGKHATDLATARHVISEQHWKRIFWIKCHIPGTRPTYSPINVTKEHVGQIKFFTFF